MNPKLNGFLCAEDVSLSKDVLEDSKQTVKEIVSKENMKPFLDENSVIFSDSDLKHVV